MKKISILFSLSVVTVIVFTSLMIKPDENERPEILSLYDSIVIVDAVWEDAYNNCKLDVMEEIISEDLEFYHDQGGLMTSKQKLNEALKNNICGKVNRELKKGSLEVYPIKGYGAVEMGLHGFYNSKDKPLQLHYAKFVHLWKRENNHWRIT